MKRGADKGEEVRSRRGRRIVVLGVAILLIWQIAQVMSMRTVGIPGVFTMPVHLTGTRRLAEGAAMRPAGVTTIHRRVPDASERSSLSPPKPRVETTSPPPILAPPPPVSVTPQTTAPKAPERAAPAPQVLTRPTAPVAPNPAPAEPERPKVAAVPPPPPARPIDLPSRSDVEGWIRSQAREFVGGVDSEGLPLYRFDVWLDAPAEVSSRIRSVSYEYIAPSAQPPSQAGNDRGTGFRVKFAGAACAEKLIVTVVLDDGRERRVEVDGCAVLN